MPSKQQETYHKRIDVRQEYGYFELQKSQLDFLFKYFRAHFKMFMAMLGTLGAQVLLEILFFSSTQTVITSINKPYYQRFSTYFLIGAACLILFYVVIVYASIFYERTYVLDFTNRVRAIMFANTVNREYSKVEPKERLRLITDISYHLSLFTLGLDNVFVSAIRWAFYLGALVVYVAVFDHAHWYYVLFVVVASVVLFTIAYFVSKKYVMKEAASYSKIVSHLVYTAFNFNVVKRLDMERAVKKDLQQVVEVDTYFRIRRDIWQRYSSHIVFIIAAVVAVTYGILTNFSQLKVNFTGHLILQGILFVYMIRILTLAVRSGIYYIPFKVGIFMCIPKLNYNMKDTRPSWNWDELTFISNKVRLYEEAPYTKDFRLTIQKAKKYLFVSPKSYAGKTALATLLGGQASYNRHSFLVKVDRQRMTYNQWDDLFGSKYLFSVYTSSMLTVGEYLLAKRAQEITSADIAKINKLVEENYIFDGFNLSFHFLTAPLENLGNNYTILFYIHVLYALIHKPEIIIIDNIWLDLNHEEIKNGIKFITDALPDATFILFSREKNKLLNYDEIYSVDSGAVQKTTI